MRVKKTSELLDEVIQDAEKEHTDQRIRFAKLKGQMEELAKVYPNDALVGAVTQIYAALMAESETRADEDLSIIRGLRHIMAKDEEERERVTSLTDDSKSLMRSMLGADEDTPEKELRERAKESGDIYTEISRRRRGEKR